MNRVITTSVCHLHRPQAAVRHLTPRPDVRTSEQHYFTGPWARVPFARGLRDLILAPNLTGLRIYRAAALP